MDSVYQPSDNSSVDTELTGAVLCLISVTKNSGSDDNCTVVHAVIDNLHMCVKNNTNANGESIESTRSVQLNECLILMS